MSTDIDTWLESHGLMIQVSRPRDEGTFANFETKRVSEDGELLGVRILAWWAEQGGEGRDPLWEGRGAYRQAIQAAKRLRVAWGASGRDDVQPVAAPVFREIVEHVDNPAWLRWFADWQEAQARVAELQQAEPRRYIPRKS